jgi:putative holliday junction resolvase
MTKYLGVDFGTRRVGLARSDGELASSWKIIEGRNVNDLLGKLEKEAADFEVIVIGIPEGRMGKVVKKVVKILKTKNINVIETDETLSSQNANKLMIQLGLSRKKRKSNDAIAASEILQNYLDNK